MTAVAHVITYPTETVSDLSADVDRLAALQAEIEGLNKRARQIKSRVCEAMESRGLDSFVSAGGVRASLFTTTRWLADRKKALSMFSADVVNAIFRPTTCTSLRLVK